MNPTNGQKGWARLLKPAVDKRLSPSTEGAVYVEFLSVFMPMLIFFFSIVQLVFLETASLVVSHSALIGARKAATVLPEDPAHMPGAINSYSGYRKSVIDEAIRYPLTALGNPDDAEISVSTPGAYNGIITVTVTFPFQCQVPAGQLLCGGASKDLTAIARMPNQGASYIYP